MMRRGYAGGAGKALLIAPLGDAPTDLAIQTDGLDNWPDGDLPFQIVIARGKWNEEKMLIGDRTGDNMLVYTDEAINGRAWDGTTRFDHEIGETVEHVHTSVDDDEANEHVNATLNVHGVDGEIAGVTAEQELENKTIDGHKNTLLNIRQSDVENLEDDLAALDAADDALQAQIDLKAPINDPTFTGDVTMPSTTTIGTVGPSEIAALEGIESNIQNQIDAISTGGGGGALPSGGDVNDVIANTAPGTGAWTDLVALLAALDIVTIPDGGEIGNALIKIGPNKADVGWGYVASTVPADADIIDDSAISAPLGHDGTGTYTDGGATYRWFRFTTVSTFFSIQNTQPVIGKLLLVGGGGAGGGNSLSYPGGGGGAGAYYYHDYAFGVGTHRAFVGAGGVYGGADAEHSIFDDLFALGGGDGGVGSTGGGSAGLAGGSGGGGGTGATNPGGAALLGSTDNHVTIGSTAFDGKAGATSASYGGDGGGANNGAGVTLALDGTSRTYAKGGAGGVNVTTSAPAANTGSGADGEPPGVYGGLGTGRNGADGIIIVRVRIA